MKSIALTLTLDPSLSKTAYNQFLDNFITHAIEANGFQYGGGLDGAICAEDNDYELTQADEARLREWLQAQSEVVTFVTHLHEDTSLVDTVIAQTKKWLTDVIIGHNFCPFAKHEFDKGSIHYAVIQSDDLQTQLEIVLAHCQALDNDKSVETSLLIFPLVLEDFEDYLDLLDLSNALLHKEGYEGVYQLASFHPAYRFEGTAQNDVSNYTNRSPYPILHILREASVEVAVARHPNPENIPQRNIDTTRALGLDVMKGLLSSAYQVP